MEEQVPASLFGKVLIFVWGTMLFAVVALNIYLIAASHNWLMRSFVFLFLLLLTVYAIYILLKKEKTGNGDVE